MSYLTRMSLSLYLTVLIVAVFVASALAVPVHPNQPVLARQPPNIAIGNGNKFGAFGAGAPSSVSSDSSGLTQYVPTFHVTSFEAVC